jgi:2-dehydro-3-deoxygluconokinase
MMADWLTCVLLYSILNKSFLKMAGIMQKVLCFGEVLLRYSPLPGTASYKQKSMPVHIGGAELNVATALCKWNIPVSYCTAIPNNFMSHAVKAYISEIGIDTTAIQFCGDRLGVYYLLQGTDVKDSGIVFDRKGSSFTELTTGIINWQELLEDVGWLHLSAIAASLNANVAAVCIEALQAAKAMNIKVSIDLNYRDKLWQYGKQPAEVMPGLMQYCDLVMGNIWSANSLLNIPLDTGIHNKGTKEAYLEHARQTSEHIQLQYPNCKTITNTFRFDKGNSGIHYYAALYTEGVLYNSPDFFSDHVVDKVGTGDCFMAGLIFGSKLGYPPQQLLNFATAAAFGKLQEKGDTTNQSIQQVLVTLQSNLMEK